MDKKHAHLFCKSHWVRLAAVLKIWAEAVKHNALPRQTRNWFIETINTLPPCWTCFVDGYTEVRGRGLLSGRTNLKPQAELTGLEMIWFSTSPIASLGPPSVLRYFSLVAWTIQYLLTRRKNILNVSHVLSLCNFEIKLLTSNLLSNKSIIVASPRKSNKITVNGNPFLGHVMVALTCGAPSAERPMSKPDRSEPPLLHTPKHSSRQLTCRPTTVDPDQSNPYFSLPTTRPYLGSPCPYSSAAIKNLSNTRPPHRASAKSSGSYCGKLAEVPNLPGSLLHMPQASQGLVVCLEAPTPQ